MRYIERGNSLSQLCIHVEDAKTLVLECSTRTMCIVVDGDCNGLVWNMPLFSLGFLAMTVAMHTFKTMKSISYTCESTHGEQDVDCEIVMVAGVSRGTNVL